MSEGQHKVGHLTSSPSSFSLRTGGDQWALSPISWRSSDAKSLVIFLNYGVEAASNAGIQQQTADKPILAHLSSLGPNTPRLTQPIPITIERGEDEYVAAFTEANIAMSGDTATEAVALLKEHILQLYKLYRRTRKLGPEPARQLALLEKYVGKTRGQ